MNSTWEGSQKWAELWGLLGDPVDLDQAISVVKALDGFRWNARDLAEMLREALEQRDAAVRNRAAMQEELSEMRAHLPFLIALINIRERRWRLFEELVSCILEICAPILEDVERQRVREAFDGAFREEAGEWGEWRAGTG